MSWLFLLSVLGGLLLLSGLFSGAETSLFSLTKIEKRRLTEKHPHLARSVNNHLDHPRPTLTAILIGNLVVNTLAAAFVTLWALKAWGPGGVSLAVFIFTVLLVIFGEIMPKTVAVKQNERFAILISMPLKVFSVLIFPVRWVARFFADKILSLMVHEKMEHSDQISETELKTLVKIGEEEGVLDRQERQMIHKLFELGERPVKDIMTPRTVLAALDNEESSEEHVNIIQQHHFTHFPVYQESIDNILGVISVQEYMLSEKKELSELWYQPLFIPETKRIDELLSEFRQQEKNFAICVDEFGGTAGIVTLEDILEEIFGEFYDEYAQVENPIRPYGHHEFIVEAKISLADFNEYFSSELEAKESSTLAGFILEKLGEVPRKGKVFSDSGFEFHIHDVIRKRLIRKVIVKPLT